MVVADILNSSVLTLPPVAAWQWPSDDWNRGHLMSFPTGKVARRVHPLRPSVTANKNSATVVRVCLHTPRLHSYQNQTEALNNVWIIKLRQSGSIQARSLAKYVYFPFLSNSLSAIWTRLIINESVCRYLAFSQECEWFFSSKCRQADWKTQYRGKNIRV